MNCSHTQEPSHDGTICNHCRKVLLGNSEIVRKMEDRWRINVCPECNGMVGEQSQVHNETCPNRYGRIFAPKAAEVIPLPQAGMALILKIEEVEEKLLDENIESDIFVKVAITRDENPTPLSS
jgi:hypothetical protein